MNGFSYEYLNILSSDDFLKKVDSERVTDIYWFIEEFESNQNYFRSQNLPMLESKNFLDSKNKYRNIWNEKIYWETWKNIIWEEKYFKLAWRFYFSYWREGYKDAWDIFVSIIDRVYFAGYLLLEIWLSLYKDNFLNNETWIKEGFSYIKKSYDLTSNDIEKKQVLSSLDNYLSFLKNNSELEVDVIQNIFELIFWRDVDWLWNKLLVENSFYEDLAQDEETHRAIELNKQKNINVETSDITEELTTELIIKDDLKLTEPEQNHKNSFSNIALSVSEIDISELSIAIITSPVWKDLVKNLKKRDFFKNLWLLNDKWIEAFASWDWKDNVRKSIYDIALYFDIILIWENDHVWKDLKTHPWKKWAVATFLKEESTWIVLELRQWKWDLHTTKSLLEQKLLEAIWIYKNNIISKQSLRW